MFRWAVEAKAFAKGSQSDVWKVWADVAAWPKWDQSLIWSRLEGSFENGTLGKLRERGFFSSSFTIQSAQEGLRFSMFSSRLFTTFQFHHFVAPWWEGNVRIVHRVEVSGLLAPLLWCVSKRKLRRSLNRALQGLAELIAHKNLSR